MNAVILLNHVCNSELIRKFASLLTPPSLVDVSCGWQDILKGVYYALNETDGMTMQDLKLFDQRQIRTVWDEVQEKWYFCVADVIKVLTDSNDVRQYIKRLRQRDSELNSVWGTICTPHQFISTDGKKHAVNCASIGGILRIVQSIPSKKAEPFKRWLAQVGAERIHQMQDPELGIQQSLMDYKRLGYSDNWINQRLKSIEIRKDLTDQWKTHNVKEGVGYATLTDIIYQAWAGLTSREYKHLKGLHQENLRDICRRGMKASVATTAGLSAQRSLP